MGAVRMRVQTADKNITIIHKYFSPSVKVLKWKAACLLETNPLKYFPAKWESSIIYKVVSSESGEKYAQIQQFTSQNMSVDFNVNGQQWRDFFTFVIMYYGLIFCQEAPG